MLKYLYFDSVEEMIKKAVPSTINLKNCSQSDAAKEDKKNWYGFNTEEELLSTINAGWEEGVKKAMAMKNLLQKDIPPVGIKRKRRNSNEGEEINLEKYIDQEFDSMFVSNERVLAIKPNSPLTINVSIGGHCGRPASDFFWKGAVATILCDLLEESGYRVKLKGHNYSCDTYVSDPNNSYTDLYFETTLKDFNDPLNFERLVTTTAMGGFFRWYGFKTIWSLPIQATGSLGTPQETLPEDVKADILVSNIYSSMEAIVFIERIIDKLIIRK